MLWWMFAVVCAYFVKGLCGFANTLIITSMLSFTTNNVNISPVELLLGLPSNLILAVKERRSIRARICLPVIALMLLGIVPGVLFLKNADAAMIKVVFGAVIIAIGTEMLLRERRAQGTKQSGVMLAVIGLLSGVLCGLFGVGALVSAYMSRVTQDSHAFKANMCAVFVAENIFRIALYTAWGILTRAIFLQALCLVPAMLLGLYLGMALSGKLSERAVRKTVVVMLIFSGAALIMTNL